MLLAWLALSVWHAAKPLPPGMHRTSMTLRLAEADVELLFESRRQPQILARELAMTEHAEQLIVLDQSPRCPRTRAGVAAAQAQSPGLEIVVLTDPSSAAFGGTPPQGLGLDGARRHYRGARGPRSIARLQPTVFRMVAQLFGWWNSPYWLRSLNAKADQRHLLVADDGAGGWNSLIGADAAVVVHAVSPRPDRR